MTKEKYWYIILGLSITIIILIIILILVKNSSDTSSPVEEYKIEIVNSENKELINEINKLDSIKNIKVNETKNLNNDSTVKLFYQLIGK